MQLKSEAGSKPRQRMLFKAKAGQDIQIM